MKPLPERRGPIEDLPWPDQLTARVVAGGPTPAIHGYDVQGDLANHYRFGEVVLLALSGEAPDEATGRAFEVAMTFSSPISIADAPTHAASLARLCGATSGGVLATGMLTLVEQARSHLESQRALLAWLDQPSPRLPEAARAQTEADRIGVARLRQTLETVGFRCEALSLDPCLSAALLSVLHGVGLRRFEQLHTALCIARLAPLSAEAMAASAGTLRDYPVPMPPFAYEEPEPSG